MQHRLGKNMWMITGRGAFLMACAACGSVLEAATLSSTLGLTWERGQTKLVVAAVTPSSAADAGKFKKDDVVLSVEGTKTVSAKEFDAALKKYQAGQRLKVLVERGEDLKSPVGLMIQLPERVKLTEVELDKLTDDELTLLVKEQLGDQDTADRAVAAMDDTQAQLNRVEGEEVHLFKNLMVPQLEVVRVMARAATLGDFLDAAQTAQKMGTRLPAPSRVGDTSLSFSKERPPKSVGGGWSELKLPRTWVEMTEEQYQALRRIMLEEYTSAGEKLATRRESKTTSREELKRPFPQDGEMRVR